LAQSYYTLLKHQPYENHPPHLFCFATQPTQYRSFQDGLSWQNAHKYIIMEQPLQKHKTQNTKNKLNLKL